MVEHIAEVTILVIKLAQVCFTELCNSTTTAYR